VDPVILIVPAVMTSLGAPAIVLGLRGRRIDDHPICRGCGFDLVGVWPGGKNCPECGAGIADARARRVGNRRRSRRMVVGGAVLLIASAGWLSITGGLFLAGPKANPYKPVWLLSYEARHARYDRASPALVELLRRIDKGLITIPASIDALVEAGLTVQGDQSRLWLSTWGDLILSARAAGRVSDAQLTRFYRQAISAEVRMHDRARVNKPAEVAIWFRYDRFCTGRAVGTVRIAPRRVTFGDVSEDLELWSGVPLESITQRVPVSSIVGATTREGPINWRFGWAVSVDSGPGLAPGEVLDWEDERSGTLIMVGPDDPLVEVLRDDALTDRIRAAIKPDVRMREGPRGTAVWVSLPRNELPVPVACEILLQWADAVGQPKELSLRPRTLAAGTDSDSAGAVLGELISESPPREGVRLILRPSLEVAERDTDVQRTWLGPDLVFPVKIERPAEPPIPGGAK